MYTEEKNRTKTFKTFADVCYDEQTNVQVDWWIADFKYRLTIFFNKYQTKKSNTFWNELEWICFSPIRNRGWPSWSSGWDSIQDVAQQAIGNHWLNYSTICLQWIFDWEEGHCCRLGYSFYLACKGLKLYRFFSVDRCWICSIFTLQAHLMLGSA